MGDPRFPAGYRVRTEALFAADGRSAVLLRRGPRKHYQLLRWHLASDEIERGQWMKGLVRLHDLTPDGSKLLYWAAQYGSGTRARRTASAPFDPVRPRLLARQLKKRRGRKIPRYLREQMPEAGPGARAVVDVWTAVSSAPYFSALAIWPSIGHWTGGGAFQSSRHILLFETANGVVPVPNVPFPKDCVVEPVLVEGWRRRPVAFSAYRPGGDPSPEERRIAASLRDGGARFVDWIDARSPEVMRFACDGRLFRLDGWTKRAPGRYLCDAALVADLTPDRFEMVQPAEWAMRW